MDIVGLGSKIVEKLVETNAIKDAADIYNLERDDILQAVTKKDRKTDKEPPGKIADNLLASIENSKGQSLSRLITALGIRGVGEVVAGDLARYFGNLDSLSKVNLAELMQIDGVGPNIAEAIVDWFQRPANQKVLAKLKKAGVWPKSMDKGRKAVGKLTGMTFVITGTLPAFSRDQAKGVIEENGGKVTDSVSKNTSYLLLGVDPGSKYDKARSLGVKIISEDELRKMVR
jgi:DNA ligase (NAD+)